MKNTTMTLHRKFGLIGKAISYSFSKTYFNHKFKEENILNSTYSNYDIESINEFKNIITDEAIVGLNVTIPYKKEIIPHLDLLNATAFQIGAVNTIKKLADGKLKGYNTDYYGFEKSIKPHLKKHHTKALILGTGGASKAVAYALDRLHINYKFISRKAQNDGLTYNALKPEHFAEYTVIINCTPLGTFPNINNCPDIPYKNITSKHLLYDLIYNPEETLFLKKGKEHGASIVNGKDMLKFQAEKAWEIWNR